MITIIIRYCTSRYISKRRHFRKTHALDLWIDISVNGDRLDKLHNLYVSAKRSIGVVR